jgi:hypothetical protein
MGDHSCISCRDTHPHAIYRPRSPEEARDLAKQMIGSKLITKQTGAGGRLCNAVGVLLSLSPMTC